ncbi:MAG: hypothetical protein AAF368_02960, partial [Planctomycetota bacterium]
RMMFSMLRALQETAPATVTEGLAAAGSDPALREKLRFLEMPEAWIVVLVLLPALALVAWLGYRRESISGPMRMLLTTLRFGALLVLLAVLFRPVFEQRREEVLQAEVVVLVDDSASMRRRDSYRGDAEARQATEALLPNSGGEPSRLDLAKAVVRSELLPRLEEGDYLPRLYRFSDALTSLGTGPATDEEGEGPRWQEQLSGSGNATELGSALGQAMALHRGRHVTDIVVVSDGRNNGGAVPLDAARAAGADGVPIHTVVVGDTRPEKNLIVELIEAPATVLAGDEIAVTVRVSGRGLDGDARTEVVLEEIGGQDGANRLVAAEDDVVVEEAGRRVVLVAPPPLQTRSLNGGERRFRVSVAPVEGETLLDDNAIELSVDLTPERIRVLYVDGYPRWEYRYLKNLLLRADENLVMQCFLLSATPDFLQEASDGPPHLEVVPTEREALLENYDVIILGDVDPLAISADPAKCEEFMASLREFVERGGGLALLGGEYENPRAFVETPLEDLVPVVIDPVGSGSFVGGLVDEFRPVLEDPSTPHEIVRLHPDMNTNRALWEDEGGLRGQYWFSSLAVRPKPGAQVLLRHPSAGNAYGRHPLLTVGYFPSGRTMFLGIDSTWMWRFRYGDRYHERFWRNAIRWLALGRLRSGDRRVRIDALKNTYDLGERVVLEARVLDEDYRPSTEPTLKVQLAQAGGSAPTTGFDREGPLAGSSRELTLELVSDRPGLYRLSFDVERPAGYRAFVERDGVRGASTEFDVVLPSRENADPSPDPDTLRAISTLTKGIAVNLTDLDRLVSKEFKGEEERRQPISSQLEDAWDDWPTLLLLLGLLSTEWILRKRLELV